MPITKQELRAVMHAAGAKWKVRGTPLPFADETPQGTGLGLNFHIDDRITTLLEAKELEHLSFRAVSPPPKAIDWRKIGKKNYVTGIRDQRDCGACVSFATCAAMEARLNILEDKPGRDLNLSEANLFNCGGGSCANGWTFVPSLNYAKSPGLGLEKDHGYVAGNMVCKKITKHYKVKGFSAASTTIARKQAISSRGPVIGGFAVFEDFGHYSSGVYRHVGGNFKGNHAVCIVGYNDTQQCWIVKNSWGPQWGEKGYFRIGYGECGIDSQFAFYDAEPTTIP